MDYKYRKLKDPEDLSKLPGISKSCLWNITNADNEILQLISKFDPKNENQKLKLLTKKNILSEKTEKLKILDQNIIDLINGEAMKMELDQSIARNDNLHELFLKIDMC